MRLLKKSAAFLIVVAMTAVGEASTASASTTIDQLGSDIDGEAAGDSSGANVALSADGTIVAISASQNDGSGSDAGHVRLFEWDGAAWVQRGGDIDAEAADDWSGNSVSLSADGSIVAIGALLNDGANGNDSGHVRVYEWDGTAWTQKGGDIDGEAADDYSGRSVSLSADGNIVATGASGNDGNGDSSGHVRLFEWDGAAWVQRGGDIDGEAAGDRSGYSVSLSSNGAIVAIGARRNSASGTNAGHVRLFEWDGATSTWVQKGDDIDGEAADDYSGHSVSLSDDGSIVAIGAIFNGTETSGHVRVYEWDGTAWTQKGSDIDGEAADDWSGWSPTLSADGSIVAIGAVFNDGINGENSGHVRLYEWDGSAWQQKGNDIDGEEKADESGLSVSLSADGTIVAIGAHLNDGINGENSGHVRVYSIATTQNITTPEPDENVELPATGSMSGIVSQVLLVLGAGGLLMLFSRRRLSVRD